LSLSLNDFCDLMFAAANARAGDVICCPRLRSNIHGAAFGEERAELADFPFVPAADARWGRLALEDRGSSTVFGQFRPNLQGAFENVFAWERGDFVAETDLRDLRSRRPASNPTIMVAWRVN